MIEAPIAIRRTTVYVGVCIIPMKQPILEMVLWIMDGRRRIFFWILTPEMQFSLRKSMEMTAGGGFFLDFDT